MTTETGWRAAGAQGVSGLAGSIRTLVLTDSEDTAQLLVSLLVSEPGFAVQRDRASGGAALNAVSRHAPQVTVVADTLEDPVGIVGALDAAMPDTAKVAILPEGDARALQAASMAGATVTLLKPFDKELLTSAIRQAHTRLARQQASAQTTPQARQQRPRIVAVHGVKGGVGATTIAVNLAAALRRETERRVLVVDADLLSGDAGVLLDMPPERDMAELLPALNELDAETVDAYFQGHSSGVHILTAPEHIQRAEEIRAEDVARTLTALRPYFDYQVVDTPSRITPVTLAVLDQADLAVVVVTPELVALRNAARLLRLAAQLGYPSEKLLLVVNRADTAKLINQAVIEEQLRRPVVVTLPSDGQALLDAMNAGELIVQTRPERGISDKIGQLAREIAGRFGWVPTAATAGQGRTARSKEAARPESGEGAPSASGSAHSGRERSSGAWSVTRLVPIPPLFRRAPRATGAGERAA